MKGLFRIQTVDDHAAAAGYTCCQPGQESQAGLPPSRLRLTGYKIYPATSENITTLNYTLAAK